MAITWSRTVIAGDDCFFARYGSQANSIRKTGMSETRSVESRG
jgi:hypothetical protein